MIIYLGPVIRFGFIMFACAQVLWYAKSDCVVCGNLGVDCSSIFDKGLTDFVDVLEFLCVFDPKFERKRK